MFCPVVPYWDILFSVLLLVWILISGNKPVCLSVSLAWPYPGLSDVRHREKFSDCGNYSLCPPGCHGFKWLLRPFCQNVSLWCIFLRVDDGKVTGIDKEVGGVTCPVSSKPKIKWKLLMQTPIHVKSEFLALQKDKKPGSQIKPDPKKCFPALFAICIK